MVTTGGHTADHAESIQSALSPLYAHHDDRRKLLALCCPHLRPRRGRAGDGGTALGGALDRIAEHGVHTSSHVCLPSTHNPPTRTWATTSMQNPSRSGQRATRSTPMKPSAPFAMGRYRLRCKRDTADARSRPQIAMRTKPPDRMACPLRNRILQPRTGVSRPKASTVPIQPSFCRLALAYRRRPLLAVPWSSGPLKSMLRLS